MREAQGRERERASIEDRLVIRVCRFKSERALVEAVCGRDVVLPPRGPLQDGVNTGVTEAAVLSGWVLSSASAGAAVRNGIIGKTRQAVEAETR